MVRLILFWMQLSLGGQGAYQKGLALAERGDLEAAAATLAGAAKVSPNDALAWKALGVVRAKQARYDLASDAFGKAYRLNPNLDDVCFFLAQSEYLQDRFRPALTTLRKCMSTDREVWRVHQLTAQSFEALGEPEHAGKEFQLALQANRQRSEQPGVQYALFLFRQGRTNDARKVLRDLLARFPNSAAGHREMGRALLQESDLPGAIRHLEQASQLDPQSAATRRLLAKLYFRQGREHDAQTQLAIANELDQGSRTDK